MINLTITGDSVTAEQVRDLLTALVGLNWYRNAHHMLSNKVKAHYHELVKKQIGDTVITTGIRLHYKVYAQRNGTDGHNIRAVMEKFICDGLVESGVIKDDSIEYLKGDSSEYFIDKLNPRIDIYIELL